MAATHRGNYLYQGITMPRDVLGPDGSSLARWSSAVVAAQRPKNHSERLSGSRGEAAQLPPGTY